MEVERVELVWLPNEKELEELWELPHSQKQKHDKIPYLKHHSVSSLCQFLRKILNIRVVIKDAQPISSIAANSKKEKTAYYDPLFRVLCELPLESCERNSIIGLINSFCAKKILKDSPQVWLFLDISFITGDLKLVNFIAYRETNVSDFSLGSVVGLNTFVAHISSESFEKYDNYKITHINAKYIEEHFEIYFNIGKSTVPIPKRSAKTHNYFKLCFSHASLQKLLICHDGKDFSLYFHYLESPLLFKAMRKDEDTAMEDANYISYHNMDDGVQFFREVNVFEGCPTKLKQEFSMNFTLKLHFKKQEYTFVKHLLDQFCDHVTPYFTPMEIITEYIDTPIRSINSNYYDCFYAMKCILSRNNELVDQITVKNNCKELNSFLAEKCKENSSALAEVMINIYNQMDQGDVLLFQHAVKTLYNKLLADSNVNQGNSQSKKGSDKDEKKVPIKRAVLMPTHVRFLPPQEQLYNRILRSCNPDYLMRVMIKDTNLSRVDFTLKSISLSNRKYSNKFLNEHVMNRLAVGIKLGNRTYNYLGMSSSQLKSHSVWCYALDPKSKKSIDEIRKDIGDLDKISEVPKYMARMGQSFSQAMGRIKVPQGLTNIDDPESDVEGPQKIYMSEDEDDDDSDVKGKKKKKKLKGKIIYSSDGKTCEEEESSEGEDEVEVKHDPYIFSDGIGRMSQEIADQIYEKLELDEDKPSAFQVRYAGCKGMLVIDPTLEGKIILFRKSMKKYDSKDDSLEILKVSKPRYLYLNRPFITILEQKGISKDTFLVLQKKMIHSSIKSMFYDEDAYGMLLSGSMLRLNFQNIHQSGISFTEDPLFRSMILSIFKNRIFLLKTKARIALPENKGRNMFGVLDETKTLEYGEVFVQYTLSDNRSSTRILKGLVVVTKSPSLHPGDVRKFTAVDVPALRHIKDCIVFPAKGHRPHPDEMAGSDLDGDEYSVVWYEELIFEEDNSPPMHFATAKKSPNKTDRPIQIADELSHFCNYILNDSVGRLASAHLARADYEPKGIKSDVCIKIAKKHAKAVDFAKSGRPANMTRNEVTYKYPDFMEKFKRNRTYVSAKALGHLYRNCKNLEFGLAATTDEMEFRLDPDLIHESWTNYKDSASRVHRLYCKKMHSKLKACSMENEGEFLSGNYVTRGKLFSDNNERMNFQEMLEFENIWLLQYYEQEFFKEFGGMPNTKPPKYTDEMMQKASAWYVVSYSQDKKNQTQYFGLPWMVSDVLAALKKTKRKESYLSSNIFDKKASYIETAIDKSIAARNGLLNNEDDIEFYKIKILDSAREVLDNWLTCQKESFVVNRDFKQMDKLIDAEFSELSERLLSASQQYIKKCQKESELRKFLSPGYYVLTTLINISEMGTGHEDIHANFSSRLQEFGMCAWVTLIRLACSCNVHYLGISDSEGHHAPSSFYKKEDMTYEQFVVEIKSGEFWEIFRENDDEIITYLMETYKLHDVALHVEPANKSVPVLRIIVKGSCYSVDCFKHETVKPEFTENAVKRLAKKSGSEKFASKVGAA